jgi:glycerophosphoryl diester phosphodiesterase
VTLVRRGSGGQLLPDALYAPPIAHRGLWAPGGAPENSLDAFESACRSGYGVELDVRLSADGEAMVFHDDNLKRMTGADGSIEQLPARELAQLRLLDGPDPIPTLAQTLELVAGRAMLLVEIKPGPHGGEATAARTGELLDRYRGPAAAISFDPEALAWVARRRPHLPRGLDAMWLEDADGEAAFVQACELADPHFLVLELGSVVTPAARHRRADGLPVIAWTVRGPEDAARVAEDCDNVIFEGSAG